jgi:hypothetical protein
MYDKIFVVDLIIIYDQNKTNAEAINNAVKKTWPTLKFKIVEEEISIMYSLDHSMCRKADQIYQNIYRTPTYMDITIHFTSNHPYSHKLAAFNYYTDRMTSLPITETAVKQDWENVITIAHKMVFWNILPKKCRTI